MLYKIDGLKFEFYEMKATFTDLNDSSVTKETYIHSIMDINHFLKRSNITNVVITRVSPSDEEKERLSVINSDNLSADLTYYAAIEFVKNGFIVPNSLLIDLPNEYHQKSFNYIKSCIKDRIRKERKVIESQGVYTNINGVDLFVRTDNDTQSKIVSAKLILEQPDIYEINALDWELYPYVWDTVNKEKITMLSKIVTNHVQSCFSISKNEQQMVEQCADIPDLLKLQLTWFDPKEMYPLNIFTELYDMDDSSGEYDMDDSSGTTDIDEMSVDEFDNIN